MTEEDDYTPIFTCEADFEKIWRRDEHVKSKCFSDVADDLVAQSFVFKSFRNEYETEHLFSKTCLRKLKSGELNFDYLVPKQESAKPTTVPGYTPESFIPMTSELTKKEMSDCFSMYLDICNNKTLDKEMLVAYNEYMPKIQKEQKLYQTIAKEAWFRTNKERHNQIKPEIVEFTNKLWKERLERVSWYPKHYIKVADISLFDVGGNNTSEMKHIKLPKHVGLIPRYNIPNLKMNKLNIYSNPIEKFHNENGEPSPVCNSYKSVHKTLHNMGYHPEVSKDKIAENMAFSTGAQVVLSTSAFLHLLDNYPKNVGKSWNLPVVIKENSIGHEKKKVIYIDKALPKKSLNAVERIKWFSKKQIKKLLTHCSGLPKNEREYTEPFDDIDYDISELETFGIEEDNDVVDKPSAEIDKPNAAIDDKPIAVIDGSSAVVDKSSAVIDEPSAVMSNPETSPPSPCSDSELIIDIDMPEQGRGTRENVVSPLAQPKRQQANQRLKEKIYYNLWSLNSENSNVLLKSNLKGLNILIRSKSGGKGKKKNDLLKVSSKLEYQTEYGAEVVTLNEGMQDWGNIFIRPGYRLLRARINPLTGDVVMFEQKTLQDLTNEIKRLYKFNPHSHLTCFHALLGKLLEFEPGNYLLSHSPENENFAQLYKSDTSKHTFNLSLSYQMVNPEEIASPRPEWCEIDRYVLTPTFLHFHRIPAMFHPKRAVPMTSKLEVRPNKGVMNKPLLVKKKKKGDKKKMLKQHMLKTISDSDT
ncbi:uncharacterized protein [Halyomorpha halys]|uniref:uncharacterized protein isoform X2 n=1 Tax=Halyomorpha halys TaxID=286706 RepID=UPI0006D514A1|nr:uncharacterized protein LOC106687405 isoform X2 [Halyomorpha halys]